MAVIAPRVAEAVVPEAAGWFVAKSPNFEIYSQAGRDSARATLLRFEQLRTLFAGQQMLPVKQKQGAEGKIRVLEFRNAQQYEPVKLTPTADAYYSSAAGADYIVMPLLAGTDFSLAAHEYAHFALHAANQKFPPWLSEGLAEIYSTVQVKAGKFEWGGLIAARVDTLRRAAWLTPSALFAPERVADETRAHAAIFYAESWAVADLLTSAPAYVARFRNLAHQLTRGTEAATAIKDVYGKSGERVIADARDWICAGGSARQTLGAVTGVEAVPVDVTAVSEWETKAVLADLFLTNGNTASAWHLYGELVRAPPTEANLLAALGTVAVRLGETDAAIGYWKHAMELGLADATLCFHYALLADQMNLPPDQVRQALERTVALRPDFDEARFRLAQVASNECDYRAVVTQLEAIREVPTARAFSYWSAMATARTQLGDRQEGETAAGKALKAARSAEERVRAAELAYIARTDLSVQFTRDRKGNLQLETIRVPHGMKDVNPFIERGDRIRTAEGTLEEVQCAEGKLTAFRVRGAEGVVNLSVPDPSRVQIRNGPVEFTCGPQKETRVKAEYSQGGVLRGLEF